MSLMLVDDVAKLHDVTT